MKRIILMMVIAISFATCTKESTTPPPTQPQKTRFRVEVVNGDGSITYSDIFVIK